ncbi:hypothetical protein BJX63DRAFT_395655 [Aspergillus granulosus]|uniref:Uncharacterized protein n=1 Tax=Aspergillus granulosus TaxID=176169 RepID=A0ABR4HBP4_9EURO
MPLPGITALRSFRSPRGTGTGSCLVVCKCVSICVRVCVGVDVDLRYSERIGAETWL